MRKLIFLVMGLSLFIHVALLAISLIFSIPQLNSVMYKGDCACYVQLATSLIERGILGFEGKGPSTMRMPGYPLFLALIYWIPGNWLYVQITQILINVVVAFQTYKIALLMSVKRFTPIIAVLFIVFNPLLVISSVSLMPETLVICLLSITIYILLKYPDKNWCLVVISIILGVAIYLKPTISVVALMLLMACVINNYVRLRSLSRVLLSLLVPGMLLVIMFLPWTIRNYKIYHTFIPLTTTSGVNLFCGNNPQANGGCVLSEPYVLPGMNEVESNLAYRDRALDWIRSNPIDFLALLPAKAARFFWPLALGTSGIIQVPPWLFWPLLIVVLTFFILTIVGLVSLMIARKYWHSLILIIPMFGLLLQSLIAFGASRFFLPSFTMLAVLGALGIEYLSHNLYRLNNF